MDQCGPVLSPMPCPGHSILPPFLLLTHMPICTHPVPHSHKHSLRGCSVPGPGAQMPKPWGSSTAKASGLSSFPRPEPSLAPDPVTSSFLGHPFPRASCLPMPAWHLASTEKPPSRLVSCPCSCKDPCDSALGATSWDCSSSGLWGPVDPSLVLGKSC